MCLINKLPAAAYQGKRNARRAPRRRRTLSSPPPLPPSTLRNLTTRRPSWVHTAATTRRRSLARNLLRLREREEFPNSRILKIQRFWRGAVSSDGRAQTTSETEGGGREGCILFLSILIFPHFLPFSFFLHFSRICGRKPLRSQFCALPMIF